MGLFGKSEISDSLKAELTTLGTKVGELTAEIANLQALKEGLTTHSAVSGELEELRQQKQQLELSIEKLKEQHERENREIEHKVGLHKKAVEHEVEHATKAAELRVREEALSGQKDQFKEHMDFQRSRFEDEVGAQRVIMQQILDRLPTFDRSHRTVEFIGTPPSETAALEAGADSK